MVARGRAKAGILPEAAGRAGVWGPRPGVGRVHRFYAVGKRELAQGFQKGFLHRLFYLSPFRDKYMCPSLTVSLRDGVPQRRSPVFCGGATRQTRSSPRPL